MKKESILNQAETIKPSAYFKAKDRSYDPCAAALKLLRVYAIEIDFENHLIMFSLDAKEDKEVRFPSFVIRMYDEKGFLLYQQKRPILFHLNTIVTTGSRHTFTFERFPEGMSKVEIFPTY